jgi:hypothetical protein
MSIKTYLMNGCRKFRLGSAPRFEREFRGLDKLKPESSEEVDELSYQKAVAQLDQMREEEV